MRGKSYDEVAPILSRICSICSAAHTLTSLKATENAFGIRVSPQTELLRELMFRGESIESHALHLFLLAVPDYLNYPSAIAMAADKPAAVLLGLRLKKLGNTDPGGHRRPRRPPGECRAGRVRQGSARWTS